MPSKRVGDALKKQALLRITGAVGGIMQVHRLPLTKAERLRPPGTPHVNWVEKRGQEEIL